MSGVMNHVASDITTQIRVDHTKVLAVFHRYHVDLAPGTKRALVNTVCLSVEVHAQAEEEIFYPVVHGLDGAGTDKHRWEHGELRGLIETLRAMEPTSPDYDATFMRLMRLVIHHVADEETILLPLAEKMLGDRLHELGARFAKRKLELTLPRTPELMGNAVRAMPASTMLIGGALAAGTYLLMRTLKRR